MPMSVAQAAKKLGISVSLVRHYEKEFELRFARTKGGQRIITERDLENLHIIRSYRDRNVPIEGIRRQLTPPRPDVTPAPQPDLKDVIGALLARQDELERVVKLQQEAIAQLLGEREQLELLGDRVRLLLEAPKEPDPQLEALAAQVAQMDGTRQREAEQLRERLEALQSAVESQPEGASEELENLQARLVELESEVRRHEPSAEEQQAIAELQQKLQEIDAALAAKARGPGEEALRGLQRRLLDLEAAFATREEPPGRDEEGLLDTLVYAIQEEARQRKPWWQFWG